MTLGVLLAICIVVSVACGVFLGYVWGYQDRAKHYK